MPPAFIIADGELVLYGDNKTWVFDDPAPYHDLLNEFGIAWKKYFSVYTHYVDSNGIPITTQLCGAVRL